MSGGCERNYRALTACPLHAGATATQQALDELDRQCGDFLARLLATVVERPDAWRAGVAGATARLREIRGLTEAHNGEARMIGAWLWSGEIDLWVDPGVDAEAVLDNARDRLDSIEAAVIATIKTFMPGSAHDAFDEVLRRSAGIFDV